MHLLVLHAACISR